MNSIRNNRSAANVRALLELSPTSLSSTRVEQIRAGRRPTSLELAILCEATGKTVSWALGIGPARRLMEGLYARTTYRARQLRNSLSDLRDRPAKQH